MKNYKYIFFDLDGTVTQSEFGIIRSARVALKKMGIDTSSESDKDMLKFIGPPLYNSFHDFYGMNEEDSLKAVQYYREYYEAGGLFDAPLYDGIKEVIETLSESGRDVFIVTSKPGVIAERIVEHFGLSDSIISVIGPDKSEKSPKKKALIERAMNENDITDKSAVVMIGDRMYDIEGANEVGVDSIGVLYGYGSREELEEAGATYIAPNPRDILSFVN
ncbi:MAG TPA: phosphoglycolate phosphatase [Lachnospiraceae bacterium]|nr:phosphoglycolate phosphatase [Lachnospiraceae bacterium]